MLFRKFVLVGLIGGSMGLAPGIAPAGTMTKVALKIAYSVTQKCNFSVCSDSLKLGGKVALEATITPAEVAQFGTSTEIDLGLNVVGTGSVFTLGDDPNYSPGDTSASFEQILTEDLISLVVTTKLSWANGKFVAKQSLKGKGTNLTPHPPEETEYPLDKLLSTNAGDKSHSVSYVPIVIEANNGGPAFYNATAITVPDFKQEMILEQKGAIGEVGETQKITIKIKDFGIL